MFHRVHAVPVALALVLLSSCGDDSVTTASAAVENTLKACTDDLDNDSDSFTDCADQDCQAFRICAGASDAGDDGDTTTSDIGDDVSVLDATTSDVLDDGDIGDATPGQDDVQATEEVQEPDVVATVPFEEVCNGYEWCMTGTFTMTVDEENIPGAGENTDAFDPILGIEVTFKMAFDVSSTSEYPGGIGGDWIFEATTGPVALGFGPGTPDFILSTISPRLAGGVARLLRQGPFNAGGMLEPAIEGPYLFSPFSSESPNFSIEFSKVEVDPPNDGPAKFLVGPLGEVTTKCNLQRYIGETSDKVVLTDYVSGFATYRIDAGPK